MNQLLIATTNPAKFAEYALLLRGFQLKLVSLREAGIEQEAPEDAATFVENARIKAAFYFARFGRPTLADDGGLEVDALGGAPGVMSHRWLGERIDDRTLAEGLIRRMVGVEPARRGARLRAAAALIYRDHDAVRENVVEATLDGIIGDRCYPDVRAGFPYRSVLYMPERRKYLAEMGEEEAARLSQRRTLVEKLGAELKQVAGS